MSIKGLSLNPEAPEFSIPSDSPIKLTHWNLSSSEFIPSFSPISSVSVPEEKKSSPKPQKKIYTYSLLLSLRDLHLTLPEEVKIPELYSKVKSVKNKKKNVPVAKEQSIKRAESIFVSSKVLKKTEKPFMEKIKKSTDELEKKSREIRCILNKLTYANFDKLSKTLVKDFNYESGLLDHLANFLFERATALNFPEIYAQLCKKLRQEFKAINLSTQFRVAIVERCRGSFYNEDLPLEGDKLMEAEFKRRRRLIGNIKFIALLHKQKMIKSEIMYECFNVLLDPKSLSEETLETCITLFKDTCPLLVASNPQEINLYYEKIVAFIDNPQYPKRIHFLIQDLVDMKSKIMTPAVLKNEVKVLREEEKKETPKPEPTGLSEDDKVKIWAFTKAYVDGSSQEDWAPEINETMKKSPNLHFEILIQIIKYGLYEFFVEKKFDLLHKLLCLIVSDYGIGSSLISRAFDSIENDMDEIKTDSPSSPKYFYYLKTLFKLA